MVVRMGIKALCVVAHPDDCIIFAWPFIEQYRELDWKILYLTYQEGDNFRADEIKSFWNKKNIPVEFLGHVDDYRDLEKGELSFDVGSALLSIMDRCSKADIILTHSQDGDYGHIHHKFVYNCVIASAKPVVFFAGEQDTNLICTRLETLDLSEIPLHADVVKDFQSIEIGMYKVDETVKAMLNGNS